jgi:2-dehydro-3-deoxyphosphogluconate aldolase / (4S)-4-hydroxy-2-oxoglutarate aldolase
MMSAQNAKLIAALKEFPIIAIVRESGSEEVVRSKVETLIEAGVLALEVTTNSTSWQKIVREYSSLVNMGVGTVNTITHVNQAHEAGAIFTVSPGTRAEVIKRSLELEMLPFPGALTPTEVLLGVEAGAEFIKIFPAGQLGINYLKALLGPLNTVKFVPTGGISTEQAWEWLQAGATAVGLGSDLTRGSAEDIRARVTALKSQIASHSKAAQ